MKAKKKIVYTSGIVLSNDDMLEEVKVDNQVFLMRCDGKTIAQWGEYEYNDVTYKPIDNAIVSTNAVLLPSAVEKYESTTNLHQEIQDFIHSYCDISEYFEKLASYYVLLSWVYEKFSVLPYLRVIGEPGTGKSRFLQVVGSLCYKATLTSGAISVASIFRMIDQFQGTLVIDEADLPIKSDEYASVVKILNCGFEKNRNVIRQEATKKGYESVAYRVFSPKLIGTRKRFADVALETRMLSEKMTKMSRPHEIPINLSHYFDEQALSLRNRLLAFRFLNYHKIKPSEIYAMSGIEPRILQIVSPMLDIMPEDEQASLIEWAKTYTQGLITERSASVEGDVVRALFEVIDDAIDADEETTVKNITNKVNEQYERDSDKLSMRRVGAILSHLGLTKRRATKSRAYAIDMFASRRTLELLRRQYGIDAENETLKRM